jgi:hypothetical protein
MANPYDEFDAQLEGKANPYDEFDNPVPSRTATGTIKDVGISLAKGTLAAGQGLVGLADIPTGGKVGKAFDSIGIRPDDWQKSLDKQFSPAQQAANKKVEAAEGFFGKAGAMLENPSTIAHGIVETLPSVAAGGVIGRGALAIGSKLAPGVIGGANKAAQAIGAGAFGEGTIAAGQSAEEIRTNTADRELTAKQAGLAALSGIGTAAFGIAGASLAGKIGKKLGIDVTDIDSLAVGLSGGKKKSFSEVVKGVTAGGISEGLFEELPQTIQETILQNAALDKPLMEGVPEGAAQAIILGGVMGGGANLLPGRGQQQPPPPVTEQPETEFQVIPPAPPQDPLARTLPIPRADVIGTVDQDVFADPPPVKVPQVAPVVNQPTAVQFEEPPLPDAAPTEEQDFIHTEAAAQERIPEEPPIDPDKPLSGPLSVVRQQYGQEVAMEYAAARKAKEQITLAGAMERVNAKVAEQRRADSLANVETTNASVTDEVKAVLPALRKMAEEIRGGAVSKSFQDKDGSTSPTVSSYPEWFKQDTVAKYNKKFGENISLSKGPVLAVLRKVEYGRPLTIGQQKIFNYLKDVATGKQAQDPEVMTQDRLYQYSREGFTLDRPEDVAVGSLMPGDEVIVEQNGVPDKLTHKGFDDKGNAILQDGVRIQADPFEQIKVLAKKQRGEIAPEDNESMVGLVKQIRASGTQQDLDRISGEIEPFFKEYPKFAPYREMVANAVEERRDALAKEVPAPPQELGIKSLETEPRQMDESAGVSVETADVPSAQTVTAPVQADASRKAPREMGRDEIVSEFIEHDTLFRRGGLPLDEAAERAERQNELRREAFGRFGIKSLDDEARDFQPVRDEEAIQRDIAALQKRLDKINANRRGAFEGGSRARTTTANANSGRLAESIDGLEEELRRVKKKNTPPDAAKVNDPQGAPSGGESFENMVAEAARWKGAAMNVAKTLTDKKEQLRHSRATTKGDLDAYLQRKFGIDETTARSVSNELTRLNIPADESVDTQAFSGEPWATALPAQPPEAQPKEQAKQPWEMTHDEYVADFETKRGTKVKASYSHYMTVSTALRQGKKVPQEAYQDYEDLAAKYKSVETNSTENQTTSADSSAKSLSKSQESDEVRQKTEPAANEQPGQRRAAPGGEFGANGEWYEGGKFIATTDHAKGSKKWKKPTGKQEVEPYVWENPPPTADNIMPNALKNQLSLESWIDGKPTFREGLQGEYATPEFVAERKARIAAWNNGARWTLIEVDKDGKRTPLSAFMDREGKSLGATQQPTPLDTKPDGVATEGARPLPEPTYTTEELSTIDVDFSLFPTADGKPMKMKAKDALQLIDDDIAIYEKLRDCVGK